MLPFQAAWLGRWHWLLCLFAAGALGSPAGQPAVCTGRPGEPTHCRAAPSEGVPAASELPRAGWHHLCQEMIALRNDLPSFVLRLSELYAARQVLSTRNLKLREPNLGPIGTSSTSNRSEAYAPVDECGADGPGAPANFDPWRLKVDLQGSRTKNIYGRPQRVILLFSRDYPFTLPTIRFPGKITSGYLGDDEQAQGRGAKFAQSLHTNTPNRELLRRLTKTASNAGSSNKPYKPYYSIHGILSALQQMLEGPLDPADQRMWQSGANSFVQDANLMQRYERHGPRHKRLYQIDGVTEEEAVDPQLLALLRKVRREPNLQIAREVLMQSGLIKEVLTDDVWSFRVFTPEFCQLLVEEIRHFEASKLPARRPNSMNNYGIILAEIGMDPLLFFLQDAIVQPLARILLPEEGSELESHHSFTIKYQESGDSHLDIHTDDSDVTFNVNINSGFEGCPLVFCGLNGAEDHRFFKVAYQHEMGHAILHRGRHRHGAEDITSGERLNLIIWSYSYNYRSSSASDKVHKREPRKPDARCVSYTHDRDFEQFKTYPPGKREQFRGRGWCPPRGKEYPGFVPDVSDDELQRTRGGQQQGGGS